jgi:MarR family transcriptional regulator, multiple antibiotic resistance protein MarR
MDKGKIEYDESAKFFSTEDADQDLYFLLSNTRYSIFRAREIELQRYRITPEQVAVFFIVQALGNKATPAAISRQLTRRPHSVSALVDRMAKKGLVEKVKDLDRKNLVRVVLTAKGQRAWEISTKRNPIHRIMEALDDKEKEKFRNSLEKLLAKARQEIGLDKDEIIDLDF